MPGLLEKLVAYDAVGIQAIWVIDPRKQVFRRYSQCELADATHFNLPGTAYQVSINEIAALVQ